MTKLALEPGLVGTADLIVAEEHTAPRVGSGHIEVLATPVMINLIEAAALAAVEGHLPEGDNSLGTHLDVTHVAATPVGMKACATARLVGVEGRTLAFDVEVRDDAELIGRGTHTRVVVTAERFIARIDQKAKDAGVTS